MPNATLADFESWLRELGRFDRTGKKVKHLKRTHGSFGEERLTVRLYTDLYRYEFHAIERADDEGFLGCQAMARKGDDGPHGRLADLSDGPLDLKTWHRILHDIVSIEMVSP